MEADDHFTTIGVFISNLFLFPKKIKNLNSSVYFT